MQDSAASFCLLVPCEGAAAEKALAVELLGRRWTVVEQPEFPKPERTPPYACVSYVWGSGRVANPFVARESISARTWTVLETVVGAIAPPAIWVDALCVAAKPAANAFTLRRLGLIYGRATEAVIVLSARASAALEQIQHQGRIDESALLSLEEDEWVSRAWTYQEIVNSRKVRFTVEGQPGILVDGSDLLNCVGVAVETYKQARGIETAAMRATNPRLDALVDVMADWKIADYLERSAYSVMAMMAMRHAEREDDYFYAMLGAIAPNPIEDGGAPLHPSEELMRACEAKGDFSFIYSSNPRAEEPGRRWRPLVGKLRAILPWHTWGTGQPGSLHQTHLHLRELHRLAPGEAERDARDFVQRWLESEPRETSSRELQAAAFARLRGWGFTGCGDCLELTGGYFLPQEPVPQGSDLAVLIATQVRWVHGAPALLVQEAANGTHRCLGTGVFVGPVPPHGADFDVD